jgi:DNA polymerase III epsilon subunit-like protein
MASYFAFDTETTGLPVNRAKPTPLNVDNWDNCRMLSMAIVEFDENHNVLSTTYEIVKPDGFEVDATHIHGITEEMANEKGIPFESVYKMITDTISKTPKMVGHNIQFDINVLQSEAIRRGLDQTVLNTIEPICTLRMAKQLFFKPVKLGILYNNLFGEDFDGAHNALNDTIAAGMVYKKMLADPRVYKEVGTKRVIIKASDVAACVGLHSYKSQGEVLDEMWKKYSPSNFTGETRDERNLRALESSQEAQQLLKSVMAHKPKDSDEVRTIVDLSTQIIQQDDKLTQSQKSMVCDHLRKMMYTTHGTNSEDLTADLDEQELHKDETFYTYPVATIKGTRYEIVGRIDRYQVKEDGSKVLVEIKNRTRGLFNKVRIYEMIQVQTYLQMLGFDEARLIEQFNQERKHYLIEKDSESWNNNIHPKLVEFCKTLHHYMV